MNVLLVITTLGHGRGGHFHDVVTTAEALSRVASVGIVELGVTRSPILARATVRKWYVPADERAPLRMIDRLRYTTSEFRADVLNAFDTTAFAFARTAAALDRRPVVLTKCGGPNPIGRFPIAESMILYSRENFSYFQRQSRHSHTRLALIPQRALACGQDERLIEELRGGLDQARPTIVRICRFVPAYTPGLLKLISLIGRLNDTGTPCQGLFIGVPEHRASVAVIRSACAQFCHMVTDERYTAAGARLLSVGTLVAATGRSVMEASALGLPVAVVSDHYDEPILMTAENVESLCEANASPRSVDPSYSRSINLERLRAIMSSDSAHREAGHLSKKLFTEYFDITSRCDDILEVYRTVRREWPIHPADWALNMARALRAIRRARYSQPRSVAPGEPCGFAGAVRPTVSPQ